MTKKNKSIAQTGIAPAVASAIQTLADAEARKRKKKGKKKSPWLNLLSGAAKVAAEVAPVVAPLLLAKHGPTRANISMVNSSSSSSGPDSMVGVATPLAIQPQTGFSDIAPIKVGSRVNGIRVTGLDFLGQISIGASGTSTGDVLASVSLNPTSPNWINTRLQAEMRLWERFRFRKFSLLFEPAVPTTQPGQLVMYIDTDPAETPHGLGLERVQSATAHAGAEMFQVWEAGCAAYLPDIVTQDFYADNEGSDVRLVSPGNGYLIGATDLDQGVYGALYAAYEVECLVPQIDNSIASLTYNACSAVSDGSWAASMPFGDSVTFAGGTLPVQYVVSGGVSTFYGLPPGKYNAVLYTTGTNQEPFAPAVTGSYTNQLSAAAAIADLSIIFYEWTVPAASYEEWQSVAFGSLQFPQDLGTQTYLSASASFYSIPQGVGLVRRSTLQDLEKRLTSLVKQMTAIQATTAAAAAAASSGAPPKSLSVSALPTRK